MKSKLIIITFMIIGMLSMLTNSCKENVNGNNDFPNTISEEIFYSQLGYSLICCYDDIYNQNLAGKNAGYHYINVNGPMGGTVNISGTTSYNNTHGITTTDLVFTMTAVKYICSYKYNNNKICITEVTLTGVSTYTGSFSYGYTSMNHQSNSLYIKGSVTYDGIINNIDMSGDVSINRSTTTSVNIFGHIVSW